MMRHASLFALAASLWTLACGSEVLVLGEEGGGPSTPPSTSSTSSSSGTGGTGAGGGGTGGTGNGGSGAMGGTGGTGGSPTCYQTNDTFDMDLVTSNQTHWGCNAGPEGTALGNLELEGQVIQAWDNTVVIDSCPPSADCLPLLNELSFSAPGLYNPVPVGAFVRVAVAVEQPWGCTQQLMIHNLPYWDGVPNPVLPAEMLYLAAADGVPATLPGAPFEIFAEPLGCYPNEPPGCGQPDDYVLAFISPLAAPIDVYMGDTVEWYLDGPEPNYLILRNLRSYESGWCDDYWNWGYWAVGSMLIDF